MKIFNAEIAENTANILLDIEAVKLSPNEPFTWASGIKSPIYCDNRKILSYPEYRNKIKKYFVELINKKYSNVDVIAGVATGAIAIGALIADYINKPFIYVRSSSKKHGLGNQIEGVLKPNQTVLVIEDLVSTGMSSLDAVEAIRQNGNNVLGMCAIFTYGFKKAAENFNNANCKLTVLSNFDNLLKVAKLRNHIDNNELKIINKWKNMQ